MPDHAATRLPRAVELAAIGQQAKPRRYHRQRQASLRGASHEPSGSLAASAAAVTGSRKSSEGSAQRRWSKMPPIFSRAHNTRTASDEQTRRGGATCPPAMRPPVIGKAPTKCASA